MHLHNIMLCYQHGICDAKIKKSYFLSHLWRDTLDEVKRLGNGTLDLNDITYFCWSRKLVMLRCVDNNCRKPYTRIVNNEEYEWFRSVAMMMSIHGMLSTLQAVYRANYGVPSHTAINLAYWCSLCC